MERIRLAWKVIKKASLVLMTEDTSLVAAYGHNTGFPAYLHTAIPLSGMNADDNFWIAKSNSPSLLCYVWD